MLKDQVLDDIASRGANVAGFASFAPNGSLRFHRIHGVSTPPANEAEAARFLLESGAPSVNIRTFTPEKPDGNPFEYGLKDPEEIAQKTAEYRTRGLYIILNETIDINDGGFSGVLLGKRAEFASRDTPRCVEKEGCAVLPRYTFLYDMVRKVYGHPLNIPYGRDHRVEFSVHPGPVGYLKQYQIIWQVEQFKEAGYIEEPAPAWPNRYSRDMGDKAFGLLMAHLAGCMVPFTRVFGRIIPYFEFGDETGSRREVWVRTCPRTKEPGLFTTKHGWLDAYDLMKREDPEGDKISSIIIQDDVEVAYAGAALTNMNGELHIEGKAGSGDEFMLGAEGVEVLPEHVVDSIRGVWERLKKSFGDVSFEWGYDIHGTPWVFQCHVGRSASSGTTIYPGNANRWVSYDPKKGIEAFRELVDKAKLEEFGIIVKGNIGITSHFGDLLRRNEVPSKIERGDSRE